VTTTELPQLPFPRDDVLEVAPLLAQLREQAPVVPVRTPAGDVAWLVTRYAEARTLFTDPRLGRSHPDPENAPRISGAALLGGPMGSAETEASDAAVLRTLLAPAFAPRRMAALRAHVADLVGDLLDRLAEAGPPADLHEALSFPLPVLVICELLGVPYADREQFRGWSRALGDLTDRAASEQALGALVGYVTGLVADKRRHPAEDLLSDLVPAGGGLLSDDQAAMIGTILLFAGHETTVARIDIGALLLAAHPDQAEALRRDPALVPRAVEEILRVAAPAGAGVPRYANADVEIAGVTIRRGDAVLLTPAAANHDPAAFPDPDGFRIDRPPRPHLAFGHGPHFCIGAGLARLELQEVFTALPARFPGLRPTVPPAELGLRDDLLTGGLVALPVTW
jgi:pentalenolactone synthase